MRLQNFTLFNKGTALLLLFCILQSINFRCQIENQVSDYRLLGASSLSMDSLIRYTIEYKQMLCSSIGVIVLFELEYLIKLKKKKFVCATPPTC